MYRLKEIIQKRPAFGIAVYSCSTAVVEIAANYGLDYLFIDAEHTPVEVTDMRNLVLTAQYAGISALVRVTRPDEIEIRKALEMGAEGVIIPHVRTRQDMETCVRGAKFPPLGRRGYDSNVHAAHFGGCGYNSGQYIEESNQNQLIMPMAEDFEFIDNIDDILSVPGVDAVSFGPADFALSKNIRKFYEIDHPEVASALTTILDRCAARDIDVMVPVVPPTYEGAKALIDRGVRFLTMGNDIMHLQNSLGVLKENVIDRYKKA